MISFHFHPPELREFRAERKTESMSSFLPHRDHGGGGGECFRSGSAGAMKNSGGQRTLISIENK